MTQHNPAAKLYCGATVNVSEQIKVARPHSGQRSTQGIDRLETNPDILMQFCQLIGFSSVFLDGLSYEGGS